MPRTVNIVGTRCTAGNHRAAQQWYADHVHQLFAFDGLWAARLAQRVGLGEGEAPDYLCSYDFADEASFQAYESSGVRAAAAADRELSWGRDGIEITWRQAWQRRYQRVAIAATTDWQVQCATPQPQPTAASAQDALRCWVQHHHGGLELYAQAPAAAASEPGPLMLWSEHAGLTSTPPTGWRCEWQGRYRLLWGWRR